MVFNIHAGHTATGKGAIGAVGYLNESDEAREVVGYLIPMLLKQGHTVYDCTDNEWSDINGNLSKIVSKCNAHKVDLDISIHLNAGGGTGCEVWGYDENTDNYAGLISENIATKIGFKNRGIKYSNALYVLRNTISPAILIECCFVDNLNDSNLWNACTCAGAIAECFGSVKSETTNFKVKVMIPDLNIRAGAGTHNAVNGMITDYGVYTIVAVENGWGKLKSGRGWISLDYTKRM